MIHFNKVSLRVRYGETDQMGVVYHGNYAQYLEIGRIEGLRELGISYKEMEKIGTMLPVVSLTINYRKSALYDDLITIETKLVKLPTVRIAFEYTIKNEAQEILVEANTVLVFMSKDSKKPIRCPDYIMEKIKKLVG